MKLRSLLFILLLCCFFHACKDSNQKTTTPKTTGELKDISELTYKEIYNVLFTNQNGGVDAHGDLYGQDAISSLSIKEENSSCGQALYLSGSANKEIALAVKASFYFPGNPNKSIVRAYKLKPTETISIGNSKLCYDGKEYDIKREIISAGFTQPK